MSFAGTSIRAVAGSLDGSLGGRVREPFKAATNIMLARYLADRQRHELVAIGYGATSAAGSLREDIEAMRRQLAGIIVPVSSHNRPQHSTK